VIKRIVTKALLLAAALLAGTAASAQDFPNRPIKIVSPYAGGALNDWLARLLAEGMAKRLGQPVIVENRPGASGQVGTNQVAKSPPDGYTLVMGSSEPLGLLSAVNPKMPYDLMKDLSFVGRVSAGIPWAVLVSTRLPVKNMTELLAYARANPGKLSYGSNGIGSTGHLAFAGLEHQHKVKMTHVPYKGVGPMVTDIVGGHLDAGLVGVGTAVPHKDSDKLRILVVTGAKRYPLVPDVPSATEAGLPNFDEELWFGIAGPAGIPAPVLERLSTTLQAVLRDPDTASKMQARGMEPSPQGPADFRKFAEAYYLKTKQIADAANIVVTE
jgi:tripartite-type tricarboxylate transporter receptor subunit TctC